MGFGSRWCRWIKWCITTARFSILINGTPEGFFASSRGLRQGDPLSPFLFILVMEVLSRMLQKVETAGFLKGFSVDNIADSPLSISHLLFADDSIIFCGADLMQLGHLRCTLLGFEAVTGLKINLQKSELMPVGDLVGLNDLAAILGCKIGSFPTTYLGLPLGAPYKSKKNWDPVLEKCRSRLAHWKLKYLSTGARVTLIKSVLSSLPTYFFSLFTAPISVIKELERMERDFLWGRREEVFKHSLVNWKAVCNPIEAGGVGIRQLKLNNDALLGKWLWRYAQDDNSLWKILITLKFGEEFGGWSSSSISGSYGSGLWKGINRLWQTFSSCLSWQHGKGDKILFWKQDWLGVGCLSAVFQDIYAIAVNKEACVSDYCIDSSIHSSWSLLLRRNVNDWELNSLLLLMELLHLVQLSNEEDSVIWKLSKTKAFSVKSFYAFLQGSQKDIFPWLKIWKAAIPTRVIFFSWCAVRGKILTMDNLQHRGYHLANRCSLCLKHEESISHLFLHCTWSAELWSFILNCFGVHLCFPNNLGSFLLIWWEQCLAKRVKHIWNLVPFCLFWIIWKERNRRIFEEDIRTVLKIKSTFLSCLYGWVREGSDFDLCSLLNFLDSLR